jgi:hypothetical protein
MKLTFTDWLAIFFTIIYLIVQWDAIHHSEIIDDVISARLQDIMVLILAYYFVDSKSNNNLPKP